MKKGFTLIELLVVIAIIALLSTLSVVALNSARIKSRDAKRVSDIRQIKTALEMYFDANEAYPSSASPLGNATNYCLNINGWQTNANCTGTVYMTRVPAEQLPTTQHNYIYTKGSGTASTYTIAYYYEGTAATKTATEVVME